MQLRDYWIVVSKRWWIFLLLTVVAASTAYLYSKSQQPIFRSSTSLYVMPARQIMGTCFQARAS